MKNSIIIAFILLNSINTYSQNYFSVIKELNLPAYELNSKNLNKEGCSKSLFESKTSYCTFEIQNNDIFDNVFLIYDELKELNSISYNVSSERKFEKKIEEILNLIKNDFGNYKTEETNTTLKYIFKKDFIELTILKSKITSEKSKIFITNINNVKIVSSYDEFNKSTYVYPINFGNWVKDENGIEYKIGFSGFKESKNIFIEISTSSPDWKFIESIQILLSNGEVITKKLTTSRDIVNSYFGVKTNEIGLALLDEIEISKIINSDTIKMRVSGKYNSDFILNIQKITALKLIFEEIY